jgi:uncharacterized delta-60 repeat protein
MQGGLTDGAAAGRDPGGLDASGYCRSRWIVGAAAMASCLLAALTFAAPAPAQVPAGGALDPSFANVLPNGNVSRVLVQPDGKILICGSFTSTLGELRQRLSRLNADGTVDPTFANPVVSGAGNPNVERMVLQPDGKIVIGGNFTSVGGKAHAYIARVNANGSVDTTFKAPTPGDLPDTNVYALAVLPSGKIIVGGQFTKFTVNGVAYSRQRVARLNADGSLDKNYLPAGTNGIVRSVITEPGGNILIGGKFNQVGALTRSNIARLTAFAGNVDGAFEANASAEVYDLELEPDGKIIVGGNFAEINFVSRNRIARLNTDGTVDKSFADANPNASVRTVAVQADGKVLLGGLFAQVGAGGPKVIARVNSDGTLDSSFNPQVNGAVTDIALQPDGKVMIAGLFNTVENQPRERVARLFGNADGGGGGSNGGGSNDGPKPTPADALNVSAVKAMVSRTGATVRSRVKVSGAGKITQLATTGSKKLKLRCRVTRTVSAASTSTFTCKMGKKGRRALKKGSLKLTLRTTFTPATGTSVTTEQKLTVKRKR